MTSFLRHHQNQLAEVMGRAVVRKAAGPEWQVLRPPSASAPRVHPEAISGIPASTTDNARIRIRKLFAEKPKPQTSGKTNSPESSAQGLNRFPWKPRSELPLSKKQRPITPSSKWRGYFTRAYEQLQSHEIQLIRTKHGFCFKIPDELIEQEIDGQTDLFKAMEAVYFAAHSEFNRHRNKSRKQQAKQRGLKRQRGRDLKIENLILRDDISDEWDDEITDTMENYLGWYLSRNGNDTDDWKTRREKLEILLNILERRARAREVRHDSDRSTKKAPPKISEVQPRIKPINGSPHSSLRGKLAQRRTRLEVLTKKLLETPPASYIKSEGPENGQGEQFPSWAYRLRLQGEQIGNGRPNGPKIVQTLYPQPGRLHPLLKHEYDEECFPDSNAPVTRKPYIRPRPEDLSEAPPEETFMPEPIPIILGYWEQGY